MKLFIKIILFFFLITSQIKASQVTDWLESEIDIILNAYKDDSFSNIERFEYIEDTINQNFAGAGIAKFVAGKAWSAAKKEDKENYIKLFKLHLALNIASLMQGYSNQSYSLIGTHETTNDVFLIDMEVFDDVNKFIIVWRVKKSKDRYYIIDLLAAGISLVITKRSEFNSMLKKIDYDLKVFNETLKKQNETSYNKLIQ